MRVLAICVCLQVVGSTASLTEAGLDALMEDAAFDEPALYLVQAKAKKLTPAVTEEVPFIDQNAFKPTLEDWTKVQNGLLLLRGHAEGSAAEGSDSGLRVMLGTLRTLLEGMTNSSKELDDLEDSSKHWIDEQQVRHQEKLAKIAKSEKNHEYDDDFITLKKNGEKTLYDYWFGVRDQQHKKYVSLTKVKHSMIERVEGMISAYESVLADHTTNQAAAGASSVPVNLQPTAIIEFCDVALKHVKKAMDEL